MVLASTYLMQFTYHKRKLVMKKRDLLIITAISFVSIQISAFYFSKESQSFKAGLKANHFLVEKIEKSSVNYSAISASSLTKKIAHQMHAGDPISYKDFIRLHGTYKGVDQLNQELATSAYPRWVLYANKKKVAAVVAGIVGAAFLQYKFNLIDTQTAAALKDYAGEVVIDDNIKRVGTFFQKVPKNLPSYTWLTQYAYSLRDSLLQNRGLAKEIVYSSSQLFKNLVAPYRDVSSIWLNRALFSVIACTTWAYKPLIMWSKRLFSFAQVEKDFRAVGKINHSFQEHVKSFFHNGKYEVYSYDKKTEKAQPLARLLVQEDQATITFIKNQKEIQCALPDVQDQCYRNTGLRDILLFYMS